MDVQPFSKKLFFVCVTVSLYFLLAFTGLLAKIDLSVIAVIHELIIIPLILAVVAICIFTLFQFFVKGKRNSHLLLSFIMSALIIAGMFLAN